MTTKAPMICIFCAKPTRVTNGAEICPENPAVAKLPYLRCDGCDASAQIKPGKTATWRLFKSALRIDREKAMKALKRLTIQKAIRRGISDEEALRDGDRLADGAARKRSRRRHGPEPGAMPPSGWDLQRGQDRKVCMTKQVRLRHPHEAIHIAVIWMERLGYLRMRRYRRGATNYLKPSFSNLKIRISTHPIEGPLANYLDCAATLVFRQPASIADIERRASQTVKDYLDRTDRGDERHDEARAAGVAAVAAALEVAI